MNEGGYWNNEYSENGKNDTDEHAESVHCEHAAGSVKRARHERTMRELVVFSRPMEVRIASTPHKSDMLGKGELGGGCK